MTTALQPGDVRRHPGRGIDGGIGTDASRPDGTLKATGQFGFSSDLWTEGMLWGATVRSPHPHAAVVSADVSAALAMPGVHCVLTHHDVPGRKTYGLENPDQPVLAIDEVRYQGEPVAVVAADDPETARRGAASVRVEYRVLPLVVDPVAALAPGAPEVHLGGNLVRHVKIRRGDPSVEAEVVVSGDYEVGMQDQAFLGTESGMAVPAEDGGVDLYIATQWLHVDRDQVAASLGLPPEKVRLTLAGVGGAFGAREDVSLQIHLCLLALRTGRPVKMVYSRQESFFGHVHRHPARIHYTHGADREGHLVFVRADMVFDGGAYLSSSTAVVGNAATLGVGPYDVPNVSIDVRGAYTNNPPCGAMRGFGAVQACFAYESQMDKLAAALGMHPVDLRTRNAMTEGSSLPTGQVVDSAAPVAELLARVRVAPMPPATSPTPPAGDVAGPTAARSAATGLLPGGMANTTHGEGVVRGVGFAVGFKNVGYSEGFDDYSTARVLLTGAGGRLMASVHTAACEVGQGLVTVEAQIVRSELGVDEVVVETADTQVGSAGSTSASRQTYVTGGAVRAACQAVREALLTRAAAVLGLGPGDRDLAEAELVEGKLLCPSGATVVVADLVEGSPIERTVQWRHRPTEALHPDTGQGRAHVQYSFAAHRAVVDVDVELGLVHVVQIATAQDVGRAMNPVAVMGQIHGGTTQGIGLALMEEIQMADGNVRNPSFTDYLIPTMVDVPPMHVEVLELADPHAPYGLRGVGEAPTLSSTPAVVAAIRAATGRALARVPVRPEHIVFGDPIPQ